MLILALESTAVAASAAVCRDGEPLAAFTVTNGNTHSETLLPMVESALKAAGVSVDDIDVFAAATGPGSFTGVRIGVATLKGLAFDRSKPVAGVSALEALAENLVPCAGILCPVMNARRGQLYNALFRFENGVLTRLTDDRAIAAVDLAAELRGMNGPVLLCGDGADVARPAMTGVDLAPVPPLLTTQYAFSVAKCALRAVLRGEVTTDAAVAPVYLRMPQAERERLARQNADRPE